MTFCPFQNEDGTKVEYRIWNPFRSKLAAAILGGVDEIWIVSFNFMFWRIMFNISTVLRVVSLINRCLFI